MDFLIRFKNWNTTCKWKHVLISYVLFYYIEIYYVIMEISLYKETPEKDNIQLSNKLNTQTASENSKWINEPFRFGLRV